MKYYTVDEAFKLLEQFEISRSKQVVTRWVSKNLIKSEKKDHCYYISEEDLLNFIDEKKPKMLELLNNSKIIKSSIETLTEKLGSIEQKITYSFQVQAEELVSIKAIENQLIEITNRMSSFNENLNLIKQIIISLEESGLNNTVTSKSKSKNISKKEDGTTQLALFEEKTVNGEELMGTNLPFNDEQILDAMHSTLLFDIFSKYKEEILGSIKNVLLNRISEWNQPLDKKKYKCLYSGKQFEMCKPFLNQTAKYVAAELLEKDGLK
ncbi:helix-turn-helix domain-containing protein [Gottfriedia sp. S16(2024)]|uniref:helix-turn-helix domain-containing protein n=1 Tax=Gottfriedia sp. S16(2024) TaxID=3162883 RepID=UPI003D1B223B